MQPKGWFEQPWVRVVNTFELFELKLFARKGQLYPRSSDSSFDRIATLDVVNRVHQIIQIVDREETCLVLIKYIEANWKQAKKRTQLTISIHQHTISSITILTFKDVYRFEEAICCHHVHEIRKVDFTICKRMAFKYNKHHAMDRRMKYTIRPAYRVLFPEVREDSLLLGFVLALFS